MRKTFKTQPRPSPRRLREAVQKALRGLQEGLDWAGQEAERGRWSDAAEDVVGTIHDVGPELRVLRAVRRPGGRRRRPTQKSGAPGAVEVRVELSTEQAEVIDALARDLAGGDRSALLRDVVRAWVRDRGERFVWRPGDVELR